MRILVAVKRAASVDDEFAVEDGAIPEQYVTHELNEWDEYAVEAAVQLAEATDDVEVVTATVGPPAADETIREALAKGADRAVRVWDDDVAAAQLLDSAVTSRLLAAVAEREEPDLILTGVQSADTSMGATGVALAERLGVGWASVVNELDVDLAGGTAELHRELEGGLDELVTVDLPAVLTVQTGLNDPRYASLRGIRQAQSKELAALELSDLGLDASAIESAIEQTDLYEPTVESEATVFEGSAEETAAELAGVLAEKGVGE